tara:strand:+ start:1522 stop:1953 length:432 start_codon:yes stop_codon:yes gene_type:complete
MSDQLIETLKRHEGVRSKVYLCSAGYETIGVGRNIAESGLGLSDDEIDYLLANDIKRVDAELAYAYPWYSDLDQVRKEAMINLSFNLGQTRLQKFVKALDHMESGTYELAANEFMDSRWSQQVGQRAVEVTEMIRTGEYPRSQ